MICWYLLSYKIISLLIWNIAFTPTHSLSLCQQQQQSVLTHKLCKLVPVEKYEIYFSFYPDSNHNTDSDELLFWYSGPTGSWTRDENIWEIIGENYLKLVQWNYLINHLGCVTLMIRWVVKLYEIVVSIRSLLSILTQVVRLCHACHLLSFIIPDSEKLETVLCCCLSDSSLLWDE